MNIALVAHDEMKNTMVGFCIAYEEILKIMDYMQQALQEKELWKKQA